jgi:hypothetical protein
MEHVAPHHRGAAEQCLHAETAIHFGPSSGHTTQGGVNKGGGGGGDLFGWGFDLFIMLSEEWKWIHPALCRRQTIVCCIISRSPRQLFIVITGWVDFNLTVVNQNSTYIEILHEYTQYGWRKRQQRWCSQMKKHRGPSNISKFTVVGWRRKLWLAYLPHINHFFPPTLKWSNYHSPTINECWTSQCLWCCFWKRKGSLYC